MAVDIFHDQVSTKECAGRGDRTRGRLHAKQTRFQTSYRAWRINIIELDIIGIAETHPLPDQLFDLQDFAFVGHNRSQLHVN